jgi:tRNA (cytidine/uridine-2'-O-)-methyltransferase
MTLASAMFEIVLFQPEIPANTGNIVRLCANTGCRLHLIEPLGFWLDDRRLRRAGLDYHQRAVITLHRNWGAWLEALGARRQLAFTTKGQGWHSDAHFEEGNALVFGPETRGLPSEILEQFPDDAKLRLPMRPGSRSLNLANAVAVVVYEAWRQVDFAGAEETARRSART